MNNLFILLEMKVLSNQMLQWEWEIDIVHLKLKEEC